MISETTVWYHLLPPWPFYTFVLSKGKLLGPTNGFLHIIKARLISIQCAVWRYWSFQCKSYLIFQWKTKVVYVSQVLETLFWFLASIIMDDDKNEKSREQPKFFFLWHLKVSPNFSLKVLDINGKKILGCSAFFHVNFFGEGMRGNI